MEMKPMPNKHTPKKLAWVNWALHFSDSRPRRWCSTAVSATQIRIAPSQNASAPRQLKTSLKVSLFDSVRSLSMRPPSTLNQLIRESSYPNAIKDLLDSPFKVEFSSLGFASLELHLVPFGGADSDHGDFLLTQPKSILPLFATLLALFCRVFRIPLSWRKCTLGPMVDWIGWRFNFFNGLVSLHPDKQKLIAQMEELLNHRHCSSKQLERFTGSRCGLLSCFFPFRPCCTCCSQTCTLVLPPTIVSAQDTMISPSSVPLTVCRASSRRGGKMETGNLGQGTGDRKWGAGNWGQQTSDRELGTGELGAGNWDRELGQGTGNWGQGTGAGTGGQGTGGSKLGTGNLDRELEAANWTGNFEMILHLWCSAWWLEPIQHWVVGTTGMSHG